jgi:hypothetical protein
MDDVNSNQFLQRIEIEWQTSRKERVTNAELREPSGQCGFRMQ